MTVHGGGRPRLVHEIEKRRLLQQYDQVRGIERERTLERLELCFAERQRPQRRGKAQPEWQVIGLLRHQPLENHPCARRIAADRETPRALVLLGRRSRYPHIHC